MLKPSCADTTVLNVSKIVATRLLPLVKIIFWQISFDQWLKKYPNIFHHFLRDAKTFKRNELWKEKHKSILLLQRQSITCIKSTVSQHATSVEWRKNKTMLLAKEKKCWRQWLWRQCKQITSHKCSLKFCHNYMRIQYTLNSIWCTRYLNWNI